MFKKSQRFSFRRGAPKQKLVTPLFVLRYQKSDPTTPSGPTYAVVAGKTVSKKAVQRNRAKRVFREVLKEVLVKQANLYDLVFFLRAPFPEYSKSAIIGELENALGEIG